MSLLLRSTLGLASLVILSPYGRAATVQGRVVGPDDKPLAATVFYISSGGWNATQKQVATAADGSFHFEVEPAKAPGAAPDAASAATQQGKARGGVAVYAPGLSLGMAFLGVDEPNTVKLSPPRKIGGLLRDDKGAPVAGASLGVSRFFLGMGSSRDRQYLFFSIPPALESLLTTKTDAKGAWEIAGVPPGATTHVDLGDNRFVEDSAQFNGEGDSDGPGQRELVARRAGEIRGRVLDALGAPAAGVPVFASPKPGQTNAREMGSYATTKADGSFRMSRVYPGTYNLLIHDPASAMARLAPSANAVPNRAAPRAEPRVAPALEGVSVAAGQIADGNALKLVAPALVKGRVVDARSGQPLAEVSVGAFGRGAPRAAGLIPGALTGADGRFELALVPGANAVYAYEADRWGSESPTPPATVPLVLQAGAGKAVALQIQRRFADVEGQIAGENGAPVPDVEITAWNTRGTGQFLRSDPKGHFSLKRMDIGSLRLDAGDEWTILSPKSLVLPATAPVQIVVRHNQLAGVTVRVVDGAGRPIEGVKMRFSMPIESEGRQARRIFSPVSDAQGFYRFKALKMPEAGRLKIESAAKKGYKWREIGGAMSVAATNGAATNGAAATIAKPDEGGFALSDVVMDRLDGVLKGVVSRGGAAASGVTVRSSGDGFGSVAQSDAAGAWVLSDQPQGEVEVLAAQDRSFGRLKTTGGAADARIELLPGAPVPAQNAARAIELFREMAPSAGARDLSEAALALAPFEPAQALELLLLARAARGDAARGDVARSDAARLQIIGALRPGSSDETLAWAQGELPQIQGDAEWVRGAAMLGHLLAERQPEAAGALFAALEPRRARLTGDAAVVGTAWAAGLAARLQLPIAPRLLDQALAPALRAPTELPSIIEPLSAGTAALAAAVLDELPPDSEGNIYLYRRAIHQVARYDAMGAQALLEQMRVLVDAVPRRPTENGQYRGRDALEFDWAFAAKDVMRALPRSEVAAATGIARRVQGWHRPSALALAAEFGSKAERLSMLDETAQAETRGDWMKNITLPRLGALAAELDPTQAAQLFESSAQSLEKQRRGMGQTNFADWSFYAAFWDPAPARLALEADWLNSQPKARQTANEEAGFGDWNRASLAMAMSAVDIDRALEWARQLSEKATPNNSSPRARALTFIGELLLQEPAKRRLLVVSPESGFNN